MIPSGNGRVRALTMQAKLSPPSVLRHSKRGILGKSATYPDHVFYDSAGGHCVFLYQFCQVVESSSWVMSKSKKGELSDEVTPTTLVPPNNPSVALNMSREEELYRDKMNGSSIMLTSGSESILYSLIQ